MLQEWMMESENKKNSLEDILIDNGDSQKQLKKILMIVALVIVILIVVIALTKMVIGRSDETQMASTALPAPAQPRESLFEEVPIESVSSVDDELTRMINQLRDSEVRRQEIQKQQLAQTSPPPPPQVQPVERTPQTTTKPQAQAPSVKQDEQKYDPHRVKNGWYVQVGSFSKFTPNQAFLKSILDKGYKYYFYKTDIDNTQVTKVLIGPYATRDEAIAHRARIKEEINDGAFLLRVTDGI